MRKKRQRKKSGFADTKAYLHKQHPANYRKKGQDDIEYITFTHHDIVEIDGKKYITIPLEKNIDVKDINSKNKKKQKSYVYPIVFVGKRSALGSERRDLKLSKNDSKKLTHYLKLFQGKMSLKQKARNKKESACRCNTSCSKETARLLAESKHFQNNYISQNIKSQDFLKKSLDKLQKVRNFQKFISNFMR